MQLINKTSIFIVMFLIVIITIPTILSQNVTDIPESLNSTSELNQIVSKATATPTIGEFIRYISNKVFLPSIATYWIIQFILILLIGLATVREDKDTYFIIFAVTQLIGAVVLFFIFVLPILPQLISRII